ncbi:MAG: hypothetical protein A2219_08695 [Elusimicrobia bacterium RIFOXYA2_FULL_50_26]|nr:MAG: hypothetical protein A2219_08695 [Elusimicrobia bacterium RIFOXYA2_FULL_50_26]OGS25143.1 MAG: hypothetical protein A2314_02770 [Elusimicrobia bacterium RIFOXYB2_FULL_50_12]
MSYNLRNKFYGVVVLCAAMLLPVCGGAMLSIKPEMQTIEITRGKAYKGFILVTNTAKEKIEVKVQPEDWTDRNNRTTDGLSWLKIKPVSFSLKPGKTKKVKFSARIPVATASSKVTQFFFSYKSGYVKGLPTGMRIGSLVYWKHKIKI